MHNWSTDVKTLKKDPEKYQIWRLEQLINFGLQGKKLTIKQLRKYWQRLAIDPQKKKVLSLWLDQTKS